jgi:membrane protease YdiL (CAAX protease family)
MDRLRRLFAGRTGLRYGWRFVIFAAATELAFLFLEGPAIIFFAAKFRLDENALTAQMLILSEIVGFLIVLIVTGAAALLERRRIDSYGLPLNRRFGRLFWDGAFVGVLTIIFVGLAMLVAGGMQLHGLALKGKEIITSPILWLFGMLLVGVSEEYLFRGYALQSLWRASDKAA